MTDSTSDALFLVQGCWKVLYVINTLSSAFKACAGSKKIMERKIINIST